MQYDAFGVEISPDEDNTNPFRYAGQYYDTETGTYYLRARYYDPATGRFTQQDGWGYANPKDPLSLNLYVYCYGNPVNYIDYTGNMAIELLNIYCFLYSRGGVEKHALASQVLTLNGLNIFKGFHEIAQLNLAKYLYNLGYSPSLETKTPRGRIDVTAGGMAWEIKPLGTSGSKQLNKYISSDTRFVAGEIFAPIKDIPIVSIFKMAIIPSDEPGVAHYYFYINDIEGKELVVSSVEVKDAVKLAATAAVLAVGALVIANLAQDIMSYGAGILDNLLVFMSALQLTTEAYFRDAYGVKVF